MVSITTIVYFSAGCRHYTDVDQRQPERFMNLPCFRLKASYLQISKSFENRTSEKVLRFYEK
jgi:hypothetical protein